MGHPQRMPFDETSEVHQKATLSASGTHGVFEPIQTGSLVEAREYAIKTFKGRGQKGSSGNGTGPSGVNGTHLYLLCRA